MYCCNLLKPGLSITLQDKFLGMVSFTLTTVSYKLLHEHKPLELPEEKYNSICEKHYPVSVFELIFSHQVGADLSSICLSQTLARKPPFQHQYRFILVTGISRAVPLCTLWKSTASFPLALARTSCDRVTEREILETHMYMLPARKAPQSPSTSNIDSPSEAFIKKW